MKILEINAYYNFGSTGNIVKSLCEAGNQNGYEMYAIYWLSRTKENESDRIIFCGEDVSPSRLRKIAQYVFAGGKLNYNTERTIRIINQIKRINPDIIHLHNLHGDFEWGSINLELLIDTIAKCGCKVIWTLHDCWPITGRCYHFSYKKCDKWKYGCGKCPQKIFDRQGVFFDYSDYNWKQKNYLYQKIKKMTIVTVSDWLNSVVKESMLKNRQVITIYNGVDTNVFVPKTSNDVRDKFRILCIGWDRRKGYKDYYKLAELLSDDEEIVVVGKRPIFRRWHKLPANIKEVDRADSKEEMAAIYRSADVYFNASPAETFGLTTIEAMSCGIPVIGYRNTATTELIEKNSNGGVLVKDGAINEVRNALNIIRNMKYSKTKLHKSCDKLFRNSIMIDKYMNLYRAF